MSRPTKLPRSRVEHIRMLDDIADDFADGAWTAFMAEHGVEVEELSEAFPHAEGCDCGDCPTFPWEPTR